jgi:F0F1-type ATP synthase membrane subunit b/b'
MDQLSGGEILGVVGMVLASLVALLGWLLRLLLPWMQKRIDTKNGAIETLIGEAQRLVAANCQLSEALLQKIQKDDRAGDERFDALKENCRRHTEQLAALVESIEEARAT